MAKYPECKDIVLYRKDDQGNVVELVNHKGICDQLSGLLYSVVSKKYKAVLHDQAHDITITALTDLKLQHELRDLLMNDGARLYLSIKFPELSLNVSDDKVYLWLTVENSYDKTCGLKLSFGALLGSDSPVYTGSLIGGRLARYTHKHTKNVDVLKLEKKIKRGAEIFQNRLRVEFEKLAGTYVESDKVLEFIDKLIPKKKEEQVEETAELFEDVDGVTEADEDEKEPDKIPTKYLQAVHNHIRLARPSSLWGVVKAVSESLSPKAQPTLTVDRRKQISNKIIRILKDAF